VPKKGKLKIGVLVKSLKYKNIDIPPKSPFDKGGLVAQA
jgi:hypothetical protein